MTDIKNKKRKYDAMETNKKINTIEDLITIIETYDTNFYEFKQLKKIYNELIDLSDIIGMERLKMDIVKLILYEVQELDGLNEMAQHIGITGGPGVGKTTIAKIGTKQQYTAGNSHCISTCVAGWFGRNQT